MYTVSIYGCCSVKAFYTTEEVMCVPVYLASWRPLQLVSCVINMSPGVRRCYKTLRSVEGRLHSVAVLYLVHHTVSVAPPGGENVKRGQILCLSLSQTVCDKRSSEVDVCQNASEEQQEVRRVDTPTELRTRSLRAVRPFVVLFVCQIRAHTCGGRRT